ncbi:MAG: hypothetical protein PHT69_15950 [Bacteroidales bacterium]|nr:hypothetical protein [Bacteroidales bacterium]
MEEILDILKYVLPSLVVFGTAYFVLKLFLENEARNRKIHLKAENVKIITPMRLQAYERIILFLERITPSNLIIRTYNQNLSAIELQSKLIQTIREEYEHNLSQQIFISDNAWDLVKSAKEEIVKLINSASVTIDDSSPCNDLNHAIIQKSLEYKELPNHKAIAYLKREISQVF